MTQRQLNLLQSIQEGIELARSDFSGPGGLNKAMDVIQEDLFREEFRSLSAGRIAYIACAMIVYRDAGNPPLT